MNTKVSPQLINNTKAAASKALEKGLITQEQFKGLTDGHVNAEDMKAADDAKFNIADKADANVVRRLIDAVSAQKTAQP